ncbi:hypothetical protein NP233_g3703 [Leucocoprinus birnbaumii]|uniref:Uncharacterized protein n=1 Tax=Leucocoprinus birnbaumii TaxID=56174 RepID=A0AAD5YTN4_9AGAR|nr:hypothetical protein NP233_g3703 [Leucocoprinus birnbaumii]
MPVTRNQEKQGTTAKPTSAHTRGRKNKQQPEHEPTAGEKHATEHDEGAEPAEKRQKAEPHQKVYKTGVIERGHICFFYRPRVQHAEAHSLEDVRNFHMLLIPRAPEFASAAEKAEKSTGLKDKADPEAAEEAEMKVLESGADAIPAKAPVDQSKEKYRLITIGKKHLPDPEKIGARGGSRKEIFWSTVTAIGENLEDLRSGLGPKTYETKTRGTRHEEASRLTGRGAYAIVNVEAPVPSKRETHFGYHLSHPPPEEMGDVQSELGITTAASFILQVKNPLAPATGPQQIHSKGAEYPDWLMTSVFGTAAEGEESQSRGREEYGLRFASCETPELLDYAQAELLMIAKSAGEEGLEESLGEGRGEALHKTEEEESKESIDSIFSELGSAAEKFPAEPLEGEWI